MNYRPPVGYSFSVSFLPSGDDLVPTLMRNNPLDTNFKEVSGLTTAIQVEMFQEGGVNDYQHPLPKPAPFGNITLRRGLLIKSELAQWVYDTLENFDIQPRDLLITLHGPLYAPIAAWNVMNAYPVKWDISGFNAMDNAIVIESIELTCRKFRRIMMESNENIFSAISPA